MKNLLFWQPKIDLFKKISKYKHGNYFLVFTNYIIWVFLFYISYLLIKNNVNTFWQLLIITIFSEIIEKFLKTKVLWKRPLHEGNNKIPNGMMKHWYQKGSFPSGHAMKVTFFLFFILQYGVFSPLLFLIITVPLVLSRIILGFHYPIDIVGGILFGIVIWFLTHLLIFPDILNQIVQIVFNFVFFIK